MKIGEPIPIEQEAMSDVVSALIDANYTLSECAATLGVDPLGGVRFYKLEEIKNSVTLLLNLFIYAQPVPLPEVEKLFSTEQMDALQRMNLIRVSSSTVASDFCLFPCYDNKYLVTDHKKQNDDINQIMPLFGESYLLSGVVNRRPVKRTLDLCTGSGIHAIMASESSEEVIGVDINPRAIAFSKFNAKLCGVDNVTFALGDLYDPVDGQFDLITANPPYNPDEGTEAGDNFWSGGKSGMELLERIVQGLPSRLTDNGVCTMVSLYPVEPGNILKDYIDMWIENDNVFEVLEGTVPDVDYDNPYVRAVPEINTDSYLFGILSLRKCVEKRGDWKKLNVPAVFNEVGSSVYALDF